MTMLLTLLICCNYKSYSLNQESKSDTSIIIKYKGIDGIFFDKEALQRLGKKTSLSDSLTVINTLNNAIINRNNESLSDCELTEINFKNYVTSSKKEKELIVKKYDLKIVAKNILIGILSTGTTVLGLIVLLK